MAACRVNMRYSVREAVELVLNEGSDSDVLDSGSEENIVDSGEESVSVDLEADSSDSDNNIFILIIGIHATSRIKPFLTVFGQFLLCCCDSKRYMTWHYGLFITHPKLSKNVYVYCIIRSSLFTTVYFKRAKTVHLQQLSTSFWGVLKELRMFSHWECGECDGYKIYIDIVQILSRYGNPAGRGEHTVIQFMMLKIFHSSKHWTWKQHSSAKNR